MDHYKETFETWNKIASLYQEKFMDLDIYDETYDFFCTSIKNSKARILDLGCGPGNITRYLLTKQPDFKVEGVDIAPNMIALAATNNPQARFKVMDCRDIAALKPGFDGIIAGFCLPYLSAEDVSKVIADCAALLNTDGILYLSFVDGSNDKSGFQTSSSGDRSYFYYHESIVLITTLIEAGFEISKIFKVEYRRSETVIEFHNIIIAKKTVG